MEIKGTIEQWAIRPLSGGGVCATGILRGVEWRTTRVARATRHGGVSHVVTETGSVYALGAEAVGIWGMQLQMARPSEYANLQKTGVL